MKTRECHTPLPDKPESSPTLGDIFRKHGDQFRSEHRLHPRQHKVMYDIEHCRCGEFGTHWEICDTCGHMEKGYGKIVADNLPDETDQTGLVAMLADST